MSTIFTQPFGITWRKALLSAPRLVPDSILHITSPLGPHPLIINLPSRGKHLIPLYVFIPCTEAAGSNTSESTFSSNTLPVLIDFHGGGFIYGSCLEQAPFCAKMARELGALVISVDYRLGPAAKFPAATDDAEDVVDAILDPSKPGYGKLREEIKKSTKKEIQIDETRIAASGFSSGGNLALGLGLSITDSETGKFSPSVFPKSFSREIPLLLFYPSLDCRLLPSERPLPPGMLEKKKFMGSLKLEAELMPTYLPRDQAGHLRASPGLARLKDGGLHEKARMLLVLPEMDTLAVQSDVWIQKVEEEGLSGILEVKRVKGVVHGWTQFPDSWLSDEHRKLKEEMFDRSRDSVAAAWK